MNEQEPNPGRDPRRPHPQAGQDNPWAPPGSGQPGGEYGGADRPDATPGATGAGQAGVGWLGAGRGAAGAGQASAGWSGAGRGETGAGQTGAGWPGAGHTNAGPASAGQTGPGGYPGSSHPGSWHPAAAHPGTGPAAGQPGIEAAHEATGYAAAQHSAGHPGAGPVPPGGGYPGAGHAGYAGWAPHGTHQFGRPPKRGHPVRSAAIVVGAVGLSVAVGLGAGHFVWQSNGASGNQNFGSIGTPGGASNAAINAQAIAGKVDPGLVDVNTELGYQGAAAAGTGIVLTSDGEVLTNNHVVEGATSIKVTDIGNGRTYTASVLGYDRSHDVAVLKLANASGLTTETLGDSSKVTVGDAVVGIGNAGGTGGDPAVASGRVTALGQSITASDESSGSSEQLTGLIQVDANIQSGDSGGPLVNANGQVIGMDTAASAGYQFNGSQGGLGQGGFGQGQGGYGQGGLGQGNGGLGQDGPGNSSQGNSSQNGSDGTTGQQGFAIPINQAVSVAHQIVGGTSSSTVHIGQTAFLGVSVSDGGGRPGQGQGRSTTGQGAVIQSVLTGGPAANAGLSAGEVITALNGRTVDSATALTTLMDQHHPGDNLTLTVLDSSGQQHSVTVTPVQGPVG
ncbi:S1-C subfamily serine protease [Amycolatopsis sulphurea]|uniref:S1-C subfamily serine protease n=1 Tax=Amycolatopsis sulphurea TaxID=76022 RepID=A0A2A9G203_9PSEU|nr:trypsin-like peptidase domain-containing protein [Amycolatopsis sulphurea]PFG56892.1 S1-C subfamily serine protease [Amycolatopsis sulphurea]